MNKKLYKLMNWADIEGIVYSEDDNPHRLLGFHKCGTSQLAQFWYPGATKATLVAGTNKYEMDLADEEGFFAQLVPKTVDKYKCYYEVTCDTGIVKEVYDPYMFEPVITPKDTEKFNNGIHYTIYDLLGAHPMNLKGIQGVYFAVWAPNALRVSVVGDFNNWDGRFHQMRRLWDSGIFEIFVPCANVNDNYKFEIKLKSGLTYLKADPYGTSAQLRPETASVVADLNGFKWTDENWLKERKTFHPSEKPMSVYELYLGSFAKPEDSKQPYYNYRELAPKIIQYVKEMGYTHIELMPVMEHPFDASWGYQIIGYYAPTSRYGSPQDFMYFMNEMHKNGIGVILDWVPAHFPRDTQGLSNFDGTCLYEHADPRQGSHPHWGTLIYNYGRPEVKNYLIANALYWIKKYHADGIRMDAVASMLYLDYGKNDGEWVANMYGGKENLDAIEFLKHLNSIIHKECPGVLSIAEESTAWPKVTESVEKDGLGFDLKWNMGWMNDFTNYMKLDPYFRGEHHGELTFSMIYAYSENFMLVLSHDEVVHGKSSMIGKMPGEIPDKFKNLRAAYGYMMMHPGKKLLFMGQDIAEFTEWNENRSVEWDLLKYDDHKNMKAYVKSLNDFYKEYPALYATDFSSDGFEWINNISANENVLVFLRNGGKPKDTLLVVCNFANEERSDYKIGVPYPGKYKELLNSDSKKFGGTNCINSKAIASKEDECDGREDSIRIKMPALSIQVFGYTAFTAKEKAEIERLKVEEKQRQEEIKQICDAKNAESTARTMAEEAKLEAQRAQAEAKEALKRAMTEAKKAEELEKQAVQLEKEAQRKLEESIKLKEEAKFIRPGDLGEDS